MVALASIGASFVNPYPRYAKYEDDGDPGDPLYLTKYIESGDLELVSFLLVRLHSKTKFANVSNFF